MTETGAVQSIVKTVQVPLSAEAAFTLFTERIGDWWPLEGHSVGGSESSVSFVDQRRLVEVLADGSESQWGEVVIWDPPRQVSFSWHPGPGASARPTQVSVRFEPGQQGTVVRLEHSGWERYGTTVTEIHTEYSSGWMSVLDTYLAAAS
jgi:uncharacterized protein YndB with AHSA1/START domain